MTATHGAIHWKGGMLVFRLQQSSAGESSLELWEELAAALSTARANIEEHQSIDLLQQALLSECLEVIAGRKMMTHEERFDLITRLGEAVVSNSSNKQQQE